MKRISVIGLLFVCASCSAAVKTSSTAQPASIDDSPPPEEAPSASASDEVEVEVDTEDPSLPPLELVEDNMDTTDFSAVVRIETAKVVGADGEPPKSTGYVNHVYEVAVLETMVGDPVEKLTYVVMADADVEPRQPGIVLFVSLCKGDGGATYHVPDNAYVFSTTAEFIEDVRALGRSPVASKKPSACSND